MDTCQEFAALLDLYVDGELPPAEAERVQAHLETCGVCRSYVDDIQAIRAAFPTIEDTPVPEGFADGVMAAIRALDYVPNQSARNLRRSESRVILTLAPNFSNPYYSSILAGIGDLAHHSEYSVLICNTGGQPENEERFLKMLDAHRADGAIFLGCRKNSQWLSGYAERYPIVQCCEYVPELEQPTVSIDNYAAAAETVRYLIRQGHRRIAMLSADNAFISTQLRRRGYEDVLREAGLPCGEELIAMADAAPVLPRRKSCCRPSPGLPPCAAYRTSWPSASSPVPTTWGCGCQRTCR